jgi:hypothetical protein
MSRIERQVHEDDRFTLMRYQNFRTPAEHVAAAFTDVPAVKRVTLFGSVASSPRTESGRRRRGHIHEPKDVDLAMWLDGGADLDHLRKLSAQGLNRLWHDNEVGVAHHQVDIFLLDATGNYPRAPLPLQSMPEAQASVQSGRLRQGAVSATA